MTNLQPIWAEIEAQHGEAIHLPTTKGRIARNSWAKAYGQLQLMVQTYGQNALNLEKQVERLNEALTNEKLAVDKYYDAYLAESTAKANALNERDAVYRSNTMLVIWASLATLAFIAVLSVWQIQQAGWQ